MSKSGHITVENLTRGVTLASAGRAADTYWASLRGLIGSKPLELGQGLLIVPCKSVHTHFMSFPIDVLYVSRELEIVGMDQEMRPWRIGRHHKRAQWVLELPAGTLRSTSTQVGDLLRVDGYDFGR